MRVHIIRHLRSVMIIQLVWQAITYTAVISRGLVSLKIEEENQVTFAFIK